MPLLRAFFALLSMFFASCAMADEVRVYAAGAAKHAVETLAPAFEKATGHTLKASYDTVGALRDRVLHAPRGAVADLVVLSDAALQSLISADRLSRVAALSLGRVVVAVAVGQGDAIPDLSSADALRQALLAAPSIAYADPARGATAGTHFAKVVEALGLRDTLREKITVLPFGVDVIHAVAEGRYALGISQSSEIMQSKGVRYAGPLPAPHGLSTGYLAALTSSSAAAQELLIFMASNEALKAFAGSGFVAGAGRSTGP